MKKLIIDVTRDGYDTEQCGRTMTVGELIDLLSEYDEDTEVFTGHDNRYTYGRIVEESFEEI